MGSSRDTFEALLQRHGRSLTRPRILVFDALLGKNPYSMHQLVAAVQGIDRASVYRTVALFEQLGIVQRIYSGWKYKLELSDIFSTHHHHLTCITCERTIAMNEVELEAFIERLATHHGFVSTAHQIEIQGHCDLCRKSASRL